MHVTRTPRGTSDARSGGCGPVVGGTVVGVGGVAAQAGAPPGTVAPATRVAWAMSVPGAMGATATIHEMVVPRGTPFTSKADGFRPGANVVTWPRLGASVVDSDESTTPLAVPAGIVTGAVPPFSYPNTTP